MKLDGPRRWRRRLAALIEAERDLPALPPQFARPPPPSAHSHPGRFVPAWDPARRSAVRDSFRPCTREALEDYPGERAGLYARLKLSGLEDAPVQLAIFCDEATEAGHGLGRKTMPETLRYSVVTAVHTLWLAARARGLGVGWVSILEPDEIARALEVPDDWALIAYLCIGYPEEEHADPELERGGWEDRLDLSDGVLRR